MSDDPTKGSISTAAVGSTIGFLSDWQRLNTAITRAKYALWIVGNRNTLITDPEWKRYLDYLVRNDCCTRYEKKSQVQFDGVCRKLREGDAALGVGVGGSMGMETLRQTGLPKSSQGGQGGSRPGMGGGSSRAQGHAAPSPTPSSFNYMLSDSSLPVSGKKRPHDGSSSSQAHYLSLYPQKK